MLLVEIEFRMKNEFESPLFKQEGALLKSNLCQSAFLCFFSMPFIVIIGKTSGHYAKWTFFTKSTILRNKNSHSGLEKL